VVKCGRRGAKREGLSARSTRRQTIDDHDNDNTTTELQDQLQAAKQKIADLETQIETQKTEHKKTIADLETQIVLLSE